MKIVATTSFASSRPPERRQLERRTLVPIAKCDYGFWTIVDLGNKGGRGLLSTWVVLPMRHKDLLPSIYISFSISLSVFAFVFHFHNAVKLQAKSIDLD